MDQSDIWSPKCTKGMGGRGVTDLALKVLKKPRSFYSFPKPQIMLFATGWGLWIDLWIRVRLIQRLVSLHQSRTAKLTFIHTLQYLISYPNSNLSPQILKIETPPVLLQFVHVNFKGHENVKRVTRALWSTFFGPYFFICFFWQIDKLKSDYWEKLRCHTWHTHTDIGK